VDIVVPGEADSAVHQHRAIGAAHVDRAEQRLGHRGRPRCVVRPGVLRVGRIPQQRARRLQLGDDLGRRMLERLERSDRLAELLAHLGIFHGHR
jgi:hypothetical protein